MVSSEDVPDLVAEDEPGLRRPLGGHADGPVRRVHVRDAAHVGGPWTETSGLVVVLVLQDVPERKKSLSRTSVYYISHIKVKKQSTLFRVVSLL